MSILRQALGERLKEGEPLAKHVNIRIGGLADLYFEAKTSEEIEIGRASCRERVSSPV